MKYIIFLFLFSKGLKEKGDIYFELADYRNALITYSRLITKEPHNEEFQRLLITTAERYIREKEKKVDLSLYEKANYYYKEGKIDSALIIAKEGFERYSFEPRYFILYQRYSFIADTISKLYYKGINAERNREYSLAYQIFRTISEIYPYYPEINKKLQSIAKKIPVKKEPVVKREIKIVRKTVPVKKKKPKKKLKVKQEDIKQKIQELYKKGIALYSEGRLEEAREIWKEILKIDPQNSKVRRNLAVVEERLRRRK